MRYVFISLNVLYIMIKQYITSGVLNICERNAPHDDTSLNIRGFDVDYSNHFNKKVFFNLQNNFYSSRFNFIKNHIQSRKDIIEIGDVNGFYIEHFGNEKSLSINFRDFSENIGNKFHTMDVNNGIFLKSKHDVGIMFETLEHLHNPILVLNQLLDLCHQGVFISIPYVKNTVIKLHMNGGHVNEYSHQDFLKILKYYNIEVIEHNVFTAMKHTPLTIPFHIHSIINHEPDCIFGVFKKFHIYYLKK